MILARSGVYGRPGLAIGRRNPHVPVMEIIGFILLAVLVLGIGFTIWERRTGKTFVDERGPAEQAEATREGERAASMILHQRPPSN